MHYSGWLKITLFFTALLLVLIVGANILMDTHGVYYTLFSSHKDKKINSAMFLAGLNQQIYNPELIFRNPERFDSFLFGTSRVSAIDTSRIMTGRFYNMSAPQALLAENLAVIKTFLKKGIKIKNVIIGLDEFSFTSRIRDHENQLITIMHPEVSGKSRASVFFKFFLRMPRSFELSREFDSLFKNVDSKAELTDNGLNLFWLQTERIITASGKPLFSDPPFVYAPFVFDESLVQEVLDQVDELKELSRKHHFNLTFFFNPIQARRYVNFAHGFLPIKQKLARHTDFYDFSGFNSITTNNLNYYEEQHYRYLVGEMIVERMFGNNHRHVPDDFGVLVTKDTTENYMHKQKREMDKYLAEIAAKK